MELDSLRYLPENLRVLRKMLNAVDSYSTYIQLINDYIETDKKKASQPDKKESSKTAEYDLHSKRYARKVYKLAVEKTARKKYDYFVEEMKAELGIASIYELVGCTEAILADKWLTTGQYNLMREDLSHIYWEYDRDMEVNGRKSKEQELQDDVLTWANPTMSQKHIPYWNSTIIVTTTRCYVIDPFGNEEDQTVEKNGEVIDSKKLYQAFRSVAYIFDKTGALFDFYRIKTQDRPVLLYFNTLSNGDDIRDYLACAEPKSKRDLARIAKNIFDLRKIWIRNIQAGGINSVPDNRDCLLTIRILQAMLPYIDDHGQSKKVEAYRSELEKIQQYVTAYVKRCSSKRTSKRASKRTVNQKLYFPVAGFCDFTFLENSDDLNAAVNYIADIPDALKGMQDYLMAWEKKNNEQLVSTILLYKKRVKKLRDNAAKEILECVGTTKDVNKNSKAAKNFEKALMNKMPGDTGFFELADRCFYSDPVCIDETVYKNI